jgi:hypothetical protein
MERFDKFVEELFEERAPDLVIYLQNKDPFWSGIRNNSLTEEVLDQHQSLLEELGMSPETSDIVKAIQTVKFLRRTVLPTPVNLKVTPTD